MNLKFRISKNISENLVYIIFYFTMFIGFFTLNFGVSSNVMYIADMLCVFGVLLSIKKILKNLKYHRIKKYVFIICAILFLGTSSAILYGFHFGLWIWALRNWGRFFLFFMICFVNLKKKDFDKIINFIINFFHINTICIIFQSIFLRNIYTQDQLNGFLGRNTSEVCVTFLLIVTVIIFSKFFSKECNLAYFLFYLLEVCLCAVIAELKAVFIFIIILFVAYALINSSLNAMRLLKYFFVTLALLIMVIIFSKWLGNMYPQFQGFLNVARIIEDMQTQGGYGHTGYIDRLNAISIINKYFFDEMGIRIKLLGIGIGNAEYSAVSELTSQFYNQYGKTFFYLNFASSDLYLEIGIVGLILYILIFIVGTIDCGKKIKQQIKVKINTPFYENIGFGMALVLILFVIYNNLLRTDSSFLLALFMAIPFAVSREKENK